TPEQVVEALARTAAWLGKNPEDTFVRTAFLGFAERKGTPEQVVEAFARTAAWLGKNPEDTSVRTAFLGFVKRHGMPDHVQLALQETRSWLEGHDVDEALLAAYLKLLRTSGRQDQVKEALQLTEGWLLEHPSSSGVRWAYAALAHSRGSSKEKASALSIAQTATADEGTAEAQDFAWVGTLHLDLREYAEARKAYESAIDEFKYYGMGHRGKGLALEGLGRLDDAETELKEGLRCAKHQGRPTMAHLNSLGWFYLRRERPAEAESVFREATEARRKEGQAADVFNWWGLGEALMRQGRYQEAADALRSALDVAPSWLGQPASTDIPGLISECERLAGLG
ncbi:MAG: tetratricopeptide repeat protein, partial [Candidatus Brocadiae bacterium]|nr:tetratricopeptide repeat protein [Candidatus Brocadiia bacterium]